MRRGIVVLALVSMVGAMTAVLPRSAESVEGPGRSPASCPSGTTRWFEQAQQGDGRPSGRPGGSDPSGIDLTYLGGHPSPLYSWVLADPQLVVTRYVLEDNRGPYLRRDDPGTQGTLRVAPNSRRIVFCFGAVAEPAISLTKDAVEFPDDDGDGVADTPVTGPTTVTYRLVVRNSGNVALDDVVVTDPSTVLDCSGLPSTLPPGGSGTCTGTRTITQADVDGTGDVLNSARASATTNGRTVADVDTYVIPIERSPVLTLTKVSSNFLDTTGDGVADSPVTAPGTVAYRLEVENTGNVTVTDVELEDPQVGSLSCSGLPGDLAPGATASCTATTDVDQALVDAGGQIVNVAEVTGLFDGRVVSDRDGFTVPVQRTPALAIDKTSLNFPDADDDGTADVGIDAPGDIVYEFTVTNTGNVTLSDVFLFDAKLDSTDCLPQPSLPRGESYTCQGTIAVDQAMIDAGSDIINTAVAYGSAGTAGRVSASDAYDVPVVQRPSLQLDKDSTSNPDGDGDNVGAPAVTDPGDVTYSYRVSNDGNVTVTNIAVTDTVTAGSGTAAVTVTCDASELSPGGSTTCSSSYSVTQGDIDAAAPVVNTATATGTGPSGQDLTATDGFLVPVSATAGLSVTKVSTNYLDTDTPGDGIADQPLTGPDTVDYEIVVTNDGNTTLTDVVIDDSSVALDCVWPGTPGTLEPSGQPGDSVTCTGSRTIDQTSFDTDTDGAVVNVVVATDATAGVAGASFFIVPFDRQPSVSLVKSSSTHPDDDGDGVADTSLEGPGDIAYDLELVNTGNVTLADPVVIDPVLTTLDCDAAGSLAPGESLTCTGSYTVDQTAFDNGVPLLGTGDDALLVANVAVAGALLPGATGPGDVVADADSFIVPFAQQPSLSLVKTSTSHPDADGDQVADAPVTDPGRIDYLLTVRNTGNVTLTDARVDDPSATDVACPTTSLAPGQSTICTATATVTQADIDAGGDVINTATASGERGTTVTASSTYDVPIQQQVGAVITKTSPSHPDRDGDGIADAPLDAPGPIDYVVTGTNTGNVTFTDVSFMDPAIPDLTCTFPGPDAVVPPGESVTCTGTVRVDQSDLDAGGDVINIATASGAATGQVFTSQAAYDIPISQAPGLEITKTPTEQALPLGETTTVTWSIQVTNTGNVTVRDLQITDTLVEDSEAVSPTPLPTCATSIDVLAPGDSIALPCTIERTITGADIANLVTVRGTTGNAGPILVAASAVVRAAPEIAVTGLDLAPWLLSVIILFGAGALALRHGRHTDGFQA